MQKRLTEIGGALFNHSLKIKGKPLTFAPQLSTRRLSKPVLLILCWLVKTQFFFAFGHNFIVLLGNTRYVTLLNLNLVCVFPFYF